MSNIEKLNRRYDRQVAAARYWLIGQADVNKDYHKVLEAMEFGMAHHNGKRNGGGPEFMHQVEIFHLLRTLRHHLNDPITVFILAFLHDAIEDAQKQQDGSKKYVTPEDIRSRWGDHVTNKLLMMSKEICGVKNLNYSLDAIFDDPDTALAKLGDRCNNISSMMGVFKRARAERYVKETVEEFLPRAKAARRKFSAQEGAFENLKLLLNCQLELIDRLMPSYYHGEEGKVEEAQSTEPKALTSQTPNVSDVKVNMILAAVGKNVDPYADEHHFLIGSTSGDLAMQCKEDFAFFKKSTENSVIVMGRKTFDSIIGTNSLNEDGTPSEFMSTCKNPLPNRHIIVLSNSIANKVSGEGYEFMRIQGTNDSSLKKPLASTIAYIKALVSLGYYNCRTDVVWIAGGASLYEQCLELELIDSILLSQLTPTTNLSVIRNKFFTEYMNGNLTHVKLPIKSSDFKVNEEIASTTYDARTYIGTKNGIDPIEAKVALSFDQIYLK